MRINQGSVRRGKVAVDLVGKSFGPFRVLSRAGKYGKNATWWCDDTRHPDADPVIKTTDLLRRAEKSANLKAVRGCAA